MSKPVTVGEMRHQSAFEDSKTPIVLVSKNNAIVQLLRGLKGVRTYGDTVDDEGNWTSVYKIEVEEDES